MGSAALLQKYPENLCSFFAGFVIHFAVFSGGIVEGQVFSMHFDNFISAMRATPQSGKAHAVREDLVEAGRASENAPWAALAGCIMPPNLFGHTMSGLHVRQAAVAGVESSRDPFHEL